MHAVKRGTAPTCLQTDTLIELKVYVYFRFPVTELFWSSIYTEGLLKSCFQRLLAHKDVYSGFKVLL